MLYTLPETAGDIIVLQATEQLTNQDFDNHFKPLLDEKLEQFQQIRVILYLDNQFSGWEESSVWTDASFAKNYSDKFIRFAVVSQQQWHEWSNQVQNNLSSGDTAAFGLLQFLNAIHWVDGSDES